MELPNLQKMLDTFVQQVSALGSEAQEKENHKILLIDSFRSSFFAFLSREKIFQSAKPSIDLINQDLERYISAFSKYYNFMQNPMVQKRILESIHDKESADLFSAHLNKLKSLQKFMSGINDCLKKELSATTRSSFLDARKQEEELFSGLRAELSMYIQLEETYTQKRKWSALSEKFAGLREMTIGLKVKSRRPIVYACLVIVCTTSVFANIINTSSNPKQEMNARIQQEMNVKDLKLPDGTTFSTSIATSMTPLTQEQKLAYEKAEKDRLDALYKKFNVPKGYKIVKIMDVRLTAYSPDKEGLMVRDDYVPTGLTAKGTSAYIFNYVAVPKEAISFYSRICIPGFKKPKIALDTGGKLNKDYEEKGIITVDVGVPDAKTAKKFGVKYSQIAIVDKA